MRNSIKDYVRTCDECQRRKEERECLAPLGDVDQPSAPFEVTSMDITGPYMLTPRKNRLKPNYNPQTWKPKLNQKGMKKLHKKPTSYQEDKQEDEHYLGRFPLKTEVQLQNRTSPDQTPNTPEPDPQSADISISENTDPNYEPPQTPT
jgi:hypothetical protein